MKNRRQWPGLELTSCASVAAMNWLMLTPSRRGPSPPGRHVYAGRREHGGPVDAGTGGGAAEARDLLALRGREGAYALSFHYAPGPGLRLSTEEGSRLVETVRV